MYKQKNFEGQKHVKQKSRNMEGPSATAAVAVAVATTKPSYYSSPEEVDPSRIRFQHRLEKGSSSVAKKVVTNSFKVYLEPSQVQQVATKGGRGGRGGRGAKGVPAKLPALAIRTTRALVTKVGIKATLPQACTDKKLREYVENADNINLMAIGSEPVPEGVRFEILFFLDPADPEDQKLKALSNAAKKAFSEYLETETPVDYNEKTIFENLKSFVRVSEKVESEYMVMELSVKRTIDGKDQFPTPFVFHNEPLLWGSLMNMTFRANLEFKVSHVMMVGNDKASFKIYLSECTLVVSPKTSLSEEAQMKAERFEKMKQATLRGAGKTSASGTPTKAAEQHEEVDDDIPDSAEVDEDEVEQPPPPPPPPTKEKKKKAASKAVASSPLQHEETTTGEDQLIPTGIITTVGKKKA